MGAYREHRPRTQLGEMVECYWTRSGQERIDDTITVVPDGCIDLILDARADECSRAFVVGTMTRPISVPISPHDIVAVRFRTGAASVFLDCDPSDLTDDRMPLAAIWKRSAIENLLERVFAAERTLDRARILESVIIDHARPSLPSERVRTAARLLRSRSVEETALAMNCSRQYLRRIFVRHTGVGPKRMQRILRFRDAFEAITASRTSLADLACELGYSDQSHMTRDFAELAGSTPGSLGA